MQLKQDWEIAFRKNDISSKEQLFGFIDRNIVTESPKEFRQFISLYALEYAISKAVSDFLSSLLEKNDEELSYYYVTNDLSATQNSIIIEPGAKEIAMFNQNEESPYHFLHLAQHNPNTLSRGLHEHNMHTADFSRQTLQNIQKMREEQAEKQKSWKDRFNEKIINPLLDQLQVAVEKEDEEEQNTIKKQLSLYF